MTELIGVRDVASGETSERSGDTLTLDVPRGLPKAAAVSVEDGRRGRYVGSDGHGVIYGVVLRPLCWRARGETCLVARTGGSKRWVRQFRLSLVEPASAAVDAALPPVTAP